jgi:hypothetical protein
MAAFFLSWEYTRGIKSSAWGYSTTKPELYEKSAVRGEFGAAYKGQADTWIDRVVADIPNAENGFTLIFSSDDKTGWLFLDGPRRRHAQGGAQLAGGEL